jgi:hypothetical protein
MQWFTYLMVFLDLAFFMAVGMLIMYLILKGEW